MSLNRKLNHILKNVILILDLKLKSLINLNLINYNLINLFIHLIILNNKKKDINIYQLLKN
jgi:hypothetical protein